jgi:hypothetical protein
VATDAQGRSRGHGVVLFEAPTEAQNAICILMMAKTHCFSILFFFLFCHPNDFNEITLSVPLTRKICAVQFNEKELHGRVISVKLDKFAK